MSLPFPFEITDVDSETNKQLLADFSGERNKFLQVGPNKYFFPSKYRDEAALLYNFKLRPDDIWVSTFARSGTTLMQEMTWVLANDLDYEAAATTPLIHRFPFIEFGMLVDPGLKAEIMANVRGDPSLEAEVEAFAASKLPLVDGLPSPRFIKTHMPFSLLPPSLLDTCKVVYVARNPKDVAVSFYYQNRLLRTQGYAGDFPTYWDYFERNLLPWAPYWDHIREAWELRDHPNLLFIFYEDLVKDIRSSILKVSSFLGKQLSKEDVERLANHLSIDNFRKNPSTNLDAESLPGLRVDGEQNFIRKGQNGGWKSEFSPELCARADAWIAKNIITIPGFAFPEP